MASIIVKKNDIDLAVDSVVKTVTVYADRAIVTRSKKAACGPGVSRIVLSNLGANIDEQSVKASVDKEGARIVSTSLEKNRLFFFKQDEDEKTYARILDVLSRICEKADDKAVFSLENRMLSDLHEYIKGLVNALILAQENSIPKFKEALDFCGTLLAKNSDSLISANTETGILSRELDVLKARLERIRSLDSREQNNVIVVIESDKDFETEVVVEYAIAGASWRTSYDSKADTDAATVELSCFGEIAQSTGESWDKAIVVLSTSVSLNDVEIPSIYPVYAGGYAEKRKKDVVVRETAIKWLGDETVMDEDSEEPEGNLGGSVPEAVPEKERVTLDNKGVSYTFTITEPVDIPPDGRWHKGLIAKASLPADIFYETVPRLREYVYLRANVKNTLRMPLLPGSVHVYRNGTYMGKSSLAYVAPDEQLCLSFGIDEDLRVKRIVYRNISVPARGLALRNTREWGYWYILYNYKSRTERVRLKEGIYVSSIKEIDIRVEKDSTEGYVMDADGIVSWDIDLPHDPFEHTKLVLHYTLTAPKDFNVENL